MIALAALVALPLRAGAEPAEAHGASDRYADRGVSIAWATLRGSDEERTQVRLRVAGEPARYAMFSLVAMNPFTGESAVLAPPGPAWPARTLSVPRRRFAEMPRTEARFFASPSDAAAGRTSLVVFYLGVPDTTPEFDDEARLRRYLEGPP